MRAESHLKYLTPFGKDVTQEQLRSSVNSPSLCSWWHSGFSIRNTKDLSHTSHLHSYDSAWTGGKVETKSLLDCPTCCCPLASFERVCGESWGCAGRWHDTLTGYSLIFVLFFPTDLENYKKNISPPTCSVFKGEQTNVKPVPKKQPSSFSSTPHGEGCMRRRDRECGRTMGG